MKAGMQQLCKIYNQTDTFSDVITVVRHGDCAVCTDNWVVTVSLLSLLLPQHSL